MSEAELARRAVAEEARRRAAAEAEEARRRAAAEAEEARRRAAAEDEARRVAVLARMRASIPPGMVLIPGGTFEMGDADERTVTRVTLSPYYVDRTEVTVRAYAQCVSAGSCTAAETGLPCNYGRGDRAEHPINCVDWTQADAFCRWRGGRLPTEAEWEYAARGTDGRTYPWGNDAPSGTRLRWSGSGSVSGTAPVGTHPAGASPFGVQDMAGNVWEWVSDWHGAYPGGSTSNPRGAYQGSSRVLRGGGWLNSDPSFFRAAFRYWDEPAYRRDYLGFRCARGGS